MASSESKNMDDLFSSLKLRIREKSDFSSILNEAAEKLQKGDTVEVNADLLELLVAVLQFNKPELSEKVAEIIDTLAKRENYRDTFTDQNLILKLCEILQQSNKDNFNGGVVKQTCRALGSLCYENDKCRKIVLQNGGLKIITDIIRSTVSLDNGAESSEVRCCAVGLLLNFVAGFEDLDIKVLRTELLDLLGDVLNCGVASKDNESAAIHCLILLGILREADSEPILNEKLCPILVKILDQSTSGELIELCLELMHSQSESAAVCLSLAKTDLCELLILLLEKHNNLANDSDTRNLFKMACDLIIIILNDDQSMNLLFKDGKGPVYTRIIQWLYNPVLELQITGILAVVNFARADSNCITMVQHGVGKALIYILSNNNKEDSDVKLQHALLSALRNLVVSRDNKMPVVIDRLLEALYPMIHVTSYPVIFKLLGTLRMVTDNTEIVAVELGRNKTLIAKVVEWSEVDHPGVQGEAVRFLAWIILNCRSRTVMDTIIDCNGVPKLLSMIDSDHDVMQNEGMLSIALLTAFRLSRVEKLLIDGKIGEKLSRLINIPEPNPENLMDLLRLTRKLRSSSSALSQHLLQHNVGIIDIDRFIARKQSSTEKKDEVIDK